MANSQLYFEDWIVANGGIAPVSNAGTPTSLGPKTSANSMSVTPATDATFTVAQYGDAGAGLMKSVDYTLGVSDAVSVFNIPDTAQGYRITNASAILRCNINAVPPNANVTSSTTPYTFTGTYNNVPIGATEVRKLVAGTSRTLQINSDTASATFTLELW